MVGKYGGSGTNIHGAGARTSGFRLLRLLKLLRMLRLFHIFQEYEDLFGPITTALTAALGITLVVHCAACIFYVSGAVYQEGWVDKTFNKTTDHCGCPQNADRYWDSYHRRYFKHWRMCTVSAFLSFVAGSKNWACALAQMRPQHVGSRRHDYAARPPRLPRHLAHGGVIGPGRHNVLPFPAQYYLHGIDDRQPRGDSTRTQFRETVTGNSRADTSAQNGKCWQC